MPAAELDQFLWDALVEIERRAQLAEHYQAELLAGAAAFRKGLMGASATSVTPAELTTVPVADHLASLPAALSPAISIAMSQVPWVPTPRLGDHGDSVALGLIDQVRDLGAVSCGLMLLGPDAAYPEHHHAPAEIYLPLAGDGEWRYGGAEDYCRLGPDSLVYNNPNDRHGAMAGPDPLLALYVLF